MEKIATDHIPFVSHEVVITEIPHKSRLQPSVPTQGADNKKRRKQKLRSRNCNENLDIHEVNHLDTTTSMIDGDRKAKSTESINRNHDTIESMSTKQQHSTELHHSAVELSNDDPHPSTNNPKKVIATQTMKKGFTELKTKRRKGVQMNRFSGPSMSLQTQDNTALVKQTVLQGSGRSTMISFNWDNRFTSQQQQLPSTESKSREDFEYAGAAKEAFGIPTVLLAPSTSPNEPFNIPYWWNPSKCQSRSKSPCGGQPRSRKMINEVGFTEIL